MGNQFSKAQWLQLTPTQPQPRLHGAIMGNHIISALSSIAHHIRVKHPDPLAFPDVELFAVGGVANLLFNISSGARPVHTSTQDIYLFNHELKHDAKTLLVEAAATRTTVSNYPLKKATFEDDPTVFFQPWDRDHGLEAETTNFKTTTTPKILWGEKGSGLLILQAPPRYAFCLELSRLLKEKRDRPQYSYAVSLLEQICTNKHGTMVPRRHEEVRQWFSRFGIPGGRGSDFARHCTGINTAFRQKYRLGNGLEEDLRLPVGQQSEKQKSGKGKRHGSLGCF